MPRDLLPDVSSAPDATAGPRDLLPNVPAATSQPPPPDDGWRSAAGLGYFLPMEMRHANDPQKALVADKEFRLAVPQAIKDIPEIPGNVARATQNLEGALSSGDTGEIGRANADIIPYQFGAGPATKFGAKAAAVTARPVVNAAKEVPGTIEDALNAAKARAPAPTQPQIASRSDQHYAAMENSNVRISPEAIGDWASNLPAQMKGYSSLTPSTLTKTNALLEDLRKIGESDHPVSFLELDNIRQSIDTFEKGSDGKFLRQIKRSLDDFGRTLTDDKLDVGEGTDAATANSELLKARSLWAKNAKMTDLQKILDVASRREDDDPNGYIRRQFGRIRDNDKQFKSYSPDEQDMIKTIAKRGTLDTLGAWLAPSKGVWGLWRPMVGAAAGNAMMGPAGAVVSPAIGMAARAMGNASRRGTAQELLDTIATGQKAPSYLDKFRQERAFRRMYGSGVTPDELP